MVDTNSLIKRIKESGIKKESISATLGISIGSLNNKLAKRTEFTLPEAKALQKILGLSDDEAIRVFFAEAVSKTETGAAYGN